METWQGDEGPVEILETGIGIDVGPDGSVCMVLCRLDSKGRIHVEELANDYAP